MSHDTIGEQAPVGPARPTNWLVTKVAVKTVFVCIVKLNGVVLIRSGVLADGDFVGPPFKDASQLVKT